MSLWLHNCWCGQLDRQLCRISVQFLYTDTCPRMSNWHLYKCVVTVSVHVLTFTWMYVSAHTHTRCSMNIFNLFTCGQSCGSCCHCHCPTCVLRCIRSFCVCDPTLGVHRGKCFSRDADCGETLKQSFACFLDSKSFSHLHKPGDRNFTLSITNQLRGTFLKIHNICSLFFSLVWGGRGCSSTDFFLRHAFHGQLKAESL